MSMQGYQQYKQQSINTMTQGELLMLLYDELVKRLIRSELSLQKEDFELFETSIVRCIDIVRYLDRTLDMKYPISRDLHRLYDYFLYMLNRVRFGRNGKVLAQIKPQLIDLRDTFRKAQEAQSI
ncbi:MAG TPA: flagellar protein FliS [Candidatus Butyricicoccus avistercoris]|uniref:Flagellar protein FliS n=1 Tax=Candidatus Butyricicoccus avistercoris TaxID=2838518 RepID=A0A9D1TIJ4_9FIRM|nr:flagellar protein FliS [Candidatus Butyricicoccus avistercoris]